MINILTPMKIYLPNVTIAFVVLVEFAKSDSGWVALAVLPKPRQRYDH